MAKQKFDPEIGKRQPPPKVDNTSLYITPVTLALMFLVGLAVTVFFNGWL